MTGAPLPAKRVVIIERDPADVQRSLDQIGLPQIPERLLSDFAEYHGRRVPFSALWDEDAASELWNYLTGAEMDRARYRLLLDMNVQPEFRRWKPDASVLMEIIEELR